MAEQIKLMKAILLVGPNKFSVKQLPIPKPGDGQVLIKVMAAPINPSDVFFLQAGSYSGVKEAPCIAGFQGSGLVVENGGGLVGWSLVNKKVAFRPIDSCGTYAQYAIAKSSECFPVESSLSFEHASMSFVNPLTAMAMLDIAQSKGVKAVIINAAASSLGRMLNRFLPTQGIEIINIVRRQEQVEVLRKEGANHIIVSTDADFTEKLKDLAEKLHAKICYDAIGGHSTNVILKCMPKFSTLYIYGGLSGENIQNIDLADTLYNHKTITGLFLPNWLQEKGTFKMLPAFYKLRKLLLREFKSEIAKECSLQEFEESLKEYLTNMTKGKVVVKPHSESKKAQQKKQQKLQEKAQQKVQGEVKVEKATE